LQIAMAPIEIGTVLRRWIEVLTATYFDWREASRARQALMVACENGRFIVWLPRQGRDNGVQQEWPNEPEESLVVLAAGATVPTKVTRAARNSLVIFQLPADLVVVRRIAVPVQAREFLLGIVRNQIERLSPWHADQVVYGFDADVDEEDAATLDVRVLIALRTVIDKARDELAAIGLPIDRIEAHRAPLPHFLSHAPGKQRDAAAPSPCVPLGGPHQLSIGNGRGWGQRTFRKLKLAGWSLWRGPLSRPSANSSLSAEEGTEAPRSVTLWSRAADVSPERLAQTVRHVGAAIAAAVALSLAVSLWAISSAASLGGESEELRARAKTLQRQIQGPTSQSLVSLSPNERAWYAKERAPNAAIVLEALSRALPDGAYLTELRLENATLRMIGLAKDAPSLIAPLERSGHLNDVHFFAPTTRGPDGTFFRFNIEAHVQPHFKIAAEEEER
jgi:Tfp pilus assembly protein PilN